MTKRIAMSSPQSPRSKGRKLPLLMLVVLGMLSAGFFLRAWTLAFHKMNQQYSLDTLPLAMDTSLASFNIDGSRGGGIDGATIRSLKERVQYLESKLNAYLAFHSDPFLSIKNPAKCALSKNIKKIACGGSDDSKCALDDQVVCLDNFAIKEEDSQGGLQRSIKEGSDDGCVVYDFGIRQSPEYGLAFAKDPFSCEVIGLDPSPISEKWWSKNKARILQEYPGYKFRGVGAAGHDGMLELREYDWDQVSILQYPRRVVDTNNCTASRCHYKFYKQQQGFSIPVTTLKTLMSDMNHKRVDLLKLDVEGSEYMFLEIMIDDLSCRKVDQLTLEWHHYDYDTRYGVTSNPQINVLVALLKDRCGLEQFWVHGAKGWPSNKRVYADMGMTLYYTLSSFKRTRWEF